MKLCNFLLTFALVLIFGSTSMHAQANKTIHQFITLDGASTNVNLNFDSKDVVIYRTPGSRIQLEMSVTIGSPNEKMLDFLIGKGRYDIISTADTEESTFNIAHKQVNAKMIIKGKECSEAFKYVVYIPASIKIITINGQNITDSNSLVAAKN